jgi:ribulose-phosphate 3-epimerase
VTDKHRTLLSGGPHVSIGVNKANMLCLGHDLAELIGAGVELVHVDVMDGVFCPGMTVGAPFVRAVAEAPGAYLTDVHLMVEDPLAHVEEHLAAGADAITFQVEAARQPHRVLQSLREADVVRGVAVCPSTSLSVVEPLLEELEYLLLLTVNPGWPGQQIVPGYERRLANARALIGEGRIALGVDGGVTKENVGTIAALGPDVIVTGTAVFADGEPAAAARLMRERAANPPV